MGIESGEDGHGLIGREKGRFDQRQVLCRKVSVEFELHYGPCCFGISGDLSVGSPRNKNVKNFDR